MGSHTAPPLRWTSRSANVIGRNPRILVVDDYVHGADALATYLEVSRLSAQALAVYGGTAALSVAFNWKPDIVLLDISMPEMDGFAVAKALRGDDRTSSLVIIALTAHDRRYVEDRASEEDFDGYCQKGLMLEPLIDLLSDLTRTTTEPENGE